MGKLIIGIILIVALLSCTTRIEVSGTLTPSRTDEPRIAISDTLSYAISTHADKRVTLQSVEPTRTADGDFALDIALDVPDGIDKVYLNLKAYGDQPVSVWGSSHLLERDDNFTRDIETDIPFDEIRWFELSWNTN
jgi:hypothetical protein